MQLTCLLAFSSQDLEPFSSFFEELLFILDYVDNIFDFNQNPLQLSIQSVLLLFLK